MKLEASGISFRYQKGNREILNNVSLEIDSKERVLSLIHISEPTRP